MKGLNKIALVTAIAALSAGAQAELKAMDDASMSAATGQAGITIELSAEVKIGEIAYVDQDDTTSGATGGQVLITDVQFGGGAIAGRPDHSPASIPAVTNRLDNVSIGIDVAGSGTNDELVAAWGLNHISVGNNLLRSPTGSAVFQLDVTEDDGTGAFVTTINSSNREVAPTIDDGDLVISFDIVNPALGLIDFGLKIGSVSLAESTTAIGSSIGSDAAALEAAGNTVLMANLSMHGALGPVDIVIDGQNGGMNINAWFGVTGSVDVPFMNTSLDFKLHDNRGQTTAILSAPGIGVDAATLNESAAHVQMQINATDSSADIAAAFGADGSGSAEDIAAQMKAGTFSGTEGLLVQVQDFSGDLDLTNITVGAGEIGGLYITDLAVQADMLIYGH